MRQSMGNAADVVFLHGAYSHGGHFQPWVEYFGARGIHAVAPTLRASLGPRGVEGRRIVDYLAAAREVVGTSRPIVVGHSIGGLLAQLLAAENLCRAIVLIAPPPIGMLPAQPGAWRYLLPLLPRILAGAPLAPSAKALRAIVLNEMSDEEQTRLIPSFVHESGVAYREMVFGAVQVDTSRLRCPALCIVGEEDRIISPKQLQLIANKVRATGYAYPRRGHWLIGGKDWEEVAEDVIEWINRTGLSYVGNRGTAANSDGTE